MTKFTDEQKKRLIDKLRDFHNEKIDNCSDMIEIIENILNRKKVEKYQLSIESHDNYEEKYYDTFGQAVSELANHVFSFIPSSILFKEEKDSSIEYFKEKIKKMSVDMKVKINSDHVSYRIQKVEIYE